MRTAAFIFVFWSVFAHAEKYVQECVSWEDYKRISQRIVFSLGEKNPSLCDPKSRFYRVIEALNLMRQLKFDGPVPPAPYNQGILGTEFYSRIVRLAPTLAWGPNEQDMWSGRRLGSAQCKSYGAYVRTTGDNIMYFCPDAFKNPSYNSATYYMSLMLHETRHQEGSGHNHISCRKGYLNCDTAIERKGAYAVSVEAYAKLGVMATNLHPSMSFLARRSAYSVSQNNFARRSTPENLNEDGLIFLTDQFGKRMAYNHRTKTQAFFELPPGLLINISQSRILNVPADSDLPAESYYKYTFQNKPEEPDDGAKEYHVWKHINSAPAARRSIFKGAAGRYHGEYNISAEIWGDEIEVHRSNSQSNEEKLFKLKLPSGKPLVFREIEDYTDFHSEHKFHIVSDEDKLFELKVPTGEDPTLVEVPNKYPGFTYVIKVPWLVATEEWAAARDKWQKIQKNKGLEYPVPEPDEKYDTYLLDRKGRVHIEDTKGSYPFVIDLIGQRFEAMAGGNMFSYEYPKELGPIGN